MPDLLGSLPVPIADQVAEVQRELRQRERVYPRMVAAGKMTQAAAERQIRTMEAVLGTLRSLE